MSKSRRKQQRRQERRSEQSDPQPHVVPMHSKPNPKPVEAQTEAQGHYILSIQTNVCTFGVGPAGTGKTYVAAGLAAEHLRDRKIDQVIITRPAEDCDEDLGFLPGELDEKFAPYFEPVRDALEDVLGSGNLRAMIAGGRIQPIPLGHMRGKSFKNTWIILDEAQNTTPRQMKMLLTRIGHNCKVIVNGDLGQQDIAGTPGLADALSRLEGLRRTGVVRFTRADCVRSGFVGDVLDRYEDE